MKENNEPHGGERRGISKVGLGEGNVHIKSKHMCSAVHESEFTFHLKCKLTFGLLMISSIHQMLSV